MDERAEPRFKTDSATVIEVVRDQAYTFDGRITDVSALGFQLELAHSLMVGETIRLTVDGYHLFAQVRRSVRSGSHFEIGVERIDQWDSPASGPTTAASAVADPPAALGRPVLRKSLDTLGSMALRELFRSSRSKVTGPRKETSTPKEGDQPNETAPPKAKRVLNYQGALLAAGCIALAGWAGGVVPWRSHGPKPSEKAASPEASAPATRPVQPKTPPLDTTPPTTASSSSQPNATQPNATQPNATPAKVNSLTTVPAKTTPLRTAPATTAAVSMPSARPSGAGTVTASLAPKTSAGPSSATVAVPAAGMANRISLKATDVSWVTACVDGKNLFSKLFKKGDAEEVPFSRLAVVRSGNSGALEVAIGKESIGTLGTWGAIRTIKVTPAGHEFVAPAFATNCGSE